MRGSILTGSLCLLLSLMLAACAQPEVGSRGKLPLRAVNEAPRANLVQHCVEDFRDGYDYFPDKLTFRHSAQLSVAYQGHYKVALLHKSE